MFGLKSRSGLAVLTLLCIVSLSSAARAQTADTVLFNGKILTVGKIYSLLTMVGGKVVYAAEPFTNMAAPKTVGKSR